MTAALLDQDEGNQLKLYVQMRLPTLILTATAFVMLQLATRAQAPLTSGLVAYYPFNGDALDMSGRGNNLQVHGAVLATDRFGRTNSSYYFDGVGSYLTAAADSLPRTTRTVSLWFNLENVTASGPSLLGYGGGGSSWDSFLCC